MSAQLPLFVSTRCGYCGRPLVVQPAGDYACSTCRLAMGRAIVGPTFGHAIEQWRLFQRAAAKGRS